MRTFNSFLALNLVLEHLPLTFILEHMQVHYFHAYHLPSSSMPAHVGIGGESTAKLPVEGELIQAEFPHGQGGGEVWGDGMKRLVVPCMKVILSELPYQSAHKTHVYRFIS